MTNKPNLNSLADFDDFGFDGGDLDRLLNAERQNNPTPQPTPPVPAQEQSQAELDKAYLNAKAEEEKQKAELNQIIAEENGTPDDEPSEEAEEDEEDFGDPTIVSTAVNMIRELGLLNLPDDAEIKSEEELNFYIEQTRENMRNDVYASIRSNIEDDPYMVQLFDYAIQGKGFADMVKMQNIVIEGMNLDHVTLETVDEQKEIYKKFLLDQNPNLAAKQLTIIMEKAEADETLSNEATEALSYFKTKNEEKVKNEMEAVKLAEENARRQTIQIEKAQREWSNRFQSTLKTRTWTEDKKKAVQQELTYVKLDENTVLPMYEAKYRMIEQDPALFQEFLDFMSNFDPKERKFKSGTNAEAGATKSAAKKLLDNLSKKTDTGAQTKKSTPVSEDTINKRQNPQRIADPNMW